MSPGEKISLTLISEYKYTVSYPFYLPNIPHSPPPCRAVNHPLRDCRFARIFVVIQQTFYSFPLLALSMDIETLMKVKFPEELERYHPITFNILEIITQPWAEVFPVKDMDFGFAAVILEHRMESYIRARYKNTYNGYNKNNGDVRGSIEKYNNFSQEDWTVTVIVLQRSITKKVSLKRLKKWEIFVIRSCMAK